jgi:CRP-like cAMP-binding protein
MPSGNDFKECNIFGTLADEMIDKLVAIATFTQYDKGDYIFKEGDAVENVFILKRGTVLIEQSIGDKITVTAGTLSDGETFGFSSIFNEGVYSTNAICSARCEVIAMNGDAVNKILQEDHSMGFYVMQNIIKVLNKRLERRTEQFLNSLSTHPEIHDLESE